MDRGYRRSSVLTVGQLRKGAAGLAHGKRRAQLEKWIAGELQARFAGRILSIDVAIADRWGAIAAEAKRKGRGMPVIDGLLAATAIHYDLSVVTRNTTDFAHTHATVFNPWKA